MSANGAARVAVAVALLSVACGPAGSDSPPSPQRSRLREGVVARVGDSEVASASVARIASAQRVASTEARERAIRDVLLANEAHALGLDASARTSFAVRAAEARALMHELLRAATLQGPATEEELDAATARHWLELDRPDAFVTAHAVVRVDTKADDAARARAQDLARQIHRAIQGSAAIGVAALAAPDLAATAEERTKPRPDDPAFKAFKEAAEAVPREGLEVTVEALPGVSADGRVVAPGGGGFDPGFSTAAASLARRGDITQPVLTPFGWHVILLLERAPGERVAPEERRRRVHDEVVTLRARAEYKRLLESLRGDAVLERSADTLLALVPTAP